jgi:hypothetical protein
MAGVPTETIERVLDDLTREQEMRPGLVRRLVSRLVPQG